MKIYKKIRYAVTLVELMVTLLIAMLVFAGIGVAMVDSVRSFPVMTERTQGDVVTDAYVAKAAFDRICRKASIKLAEIDTDGTYVIVYSYNDANSISLDRYARFRVSNGSLLVDYGTYNATTKGTTLTSTETLAENVATAKFDVQGSTVTMILSLLKASNNQEMTITCAALRQNE